MIPMLLAAIPLLLAALAPQPGISPDDLVLLLEIGVGESEIIAYADVRGGFEPIDAEHWAVLESLGAGERLRARLVRREPDFGELSSLAKTSEVFQDRESGVSFVHPAGWTVSRTQRGHGAIAYRITPRSAGEPRVFLTPCVFLFVQPDSGLVPEAVEPALGEVRRMVLRRLRDAGMRPVAAESESAPFLGGKRETFRVEAAVDGSGVGALELALIVDPRGKAAGVGYTAPAGDAASTAEAFERVAKSFVLR
jgi:hypothetical protein